MSAPPPIAEAVGARLAHFPPALRGGDDLVFDYRVTESVPVPPGGRRVYESDLGDVRYQEDDDRLTIACGGRIGLDCDPKSGRVEVSLLASEQANLWLLSRPLFTLPLMELLKRRERFPLHAASVARDGRGLLLVGSTGSGKSTLAVALVRDGFDFLGDDLTFLSPANGSVRALGFADEVDLTDESVRLFPELAGLAERPSEPGWPKRRLAASAFGSDVVSECEPAVLVFPRVTADPTGALTPLDSGQALMDLLPNVLLTEQASSQAHVDALGLLVQATRAYRLDVGRDLDELPRLLQGALEPA